MSSPLPRVVIVGAGFAGLRAARQLAGAPVQVILVDQNNYHLFQPLLYQVATAGVSATDIAYPVRAIFRKQANFSFRMATVTGVDFAFHQVLTDRGPIPYDQLILGVGGETNTFGLQGVTRHAFPLKSLDDAIRLRNHVLRMFELSAQAVDPASRAALRTFVVVGGGPTGVECAGALSELIRLVLVKDFPGLDFSDVQVHLVERMDSLLPGFPPDVKRRRGRDSAPQACDRGFWLAGAGLRRGSDQPPGRLAAPRPHPGLGGGRPGGIFTQTDRPAHQPPGTCPGAAHPAGTRV